LATIDSMSFARRNFQNLGNLDQAIKVITFDRIYPDKTNRCVHTKLDVDTMK
jgi:hypothetical protein